MALLAIALGGCASESVHVDPLQQPHAYSLASASALAFDPPVLAGEPRLDLSRDGRGPAAFDGFDEGRTTYYFLQSNDWYLDFAVRGARGGQFPDYYQRHAVSETFGISYH
jgi:hypothetical protein